MDKSQGITETVFFSGGPVVTVSRSGASARRTKATALGPGVRLESCVRKGTNTSKIIGPGDVLEKRLVGGGAQVSLR